MVGWSTENSDVTAQSSLFEGTYIYTVVHILRELMDIFLIQTLTETELSVGIFGVTMLLCNLFSVDEQWIHLPLEFFP